MLPFQKAKPEVLDHWYTRVPCFNVSTQEFYATIEQELNDRKVPGLQTSRVEYAEGGMLSDKRQYLHFVRERLTFDICAAPFGSAFFFSCRFGEIPAVVSIGELLLLAIIFFFGGLLSVVLCLKVFGLLAPFVWPVAFIAFLLLAIYTMRNAVAMGLTDLDAILLKIPAVGSMYAAWFRRDTFYRQDTRLMYHDTINEVVKQQIEEVTGAKGITLIRYNQHSPILQDLYRPTVVQLPEKQKAA